MYSEQDIEDILSSNDVVLLKFSADWCESCKKYEHFINDVNVCVITIDFDLNDDLADDYEIVKLPTVLVFKNNNLVDRIEGFIPKTEFVKRLTNVTD